MTKDQLLKFAKAISAMIKETYPISEVATELLFESPKKSLEIGQPLAAIQSSLEELGEILTREFAALNASEGQGALAE